jgi:hypothetical protein
MPTVPALALQGPRQMAAERINSWRFGTQRVRPKQQVQRERRRR